MKLEEAAESRDSFCKAVFQRLFEWIVQKINSQLCSQSHELSISILDIFGFEIMQVICLNDSQIFLEEYV
jgi:myosin-1